MNKQIGGYMNGKVTTTFYLNNRTKTFNSDSESENLSQFLDVYGGTSPDSSKMVFKFAKMYGDLYGVKSKIITSIQREGNVSLNFHYRGKEEIDNFLNCKFKSIL